MAGKKKKSPEDIILQHPKFRFRRKIAAFDFDKTLVTPKSASRFPKDKDDWKWLRDNVVNVVHDYYKKGFSIVIFTNQSKLWKKDQIEHVLNSIGVPYKAYIIYNKALQKPAPHYFNAHIKHLFNPDDDELINNANRKRLLCGCFYVGDALGRPKYDWSDSDLKFANACKLTCLEPETVFPFKPASKYTIKNITHQEIVMLGGYPASGKSTLAVKYFTKPNYAILIGDDLKTDSKMKKAIKLNVQSGKSAVIDATNTSLKKRKIFIDLANKLGVPIRAIYLNTSIEQSMWRNSKRPQPVPPIAYWALRKRLVLPTKSEGLSDVTILN